MVPQVVSVQLVNISTITFGLMNGGYIYSIHGDYKLTNMSLGGTTLIGTKTFGPPEFLGVNVANVASSGPTFEAEQL